MENWKATMDALNLDSTNGRSASFNPLEAIDADSMGALLLQLCEIGLNAEEDRAELIDQIEAIVPALIELRDGGYISLNFGVVTTYATLDGFTRLAADDRLTSLTRMQCRAIRNRMIAGGVKALLGHL